MKKGHGEESEKEKAIPRDDGDLVAKVRGGDAEAWGELYREYATAVYRFCLGVLPEPADAEDATAEVFLRVRLRLHQYDPERPFKAWLFTVAANHCWDELRRRRTRGDESTEEAPVPTSEPDPYERLLQERTEREIAAGLKKIPARSRLALTLRYYADLSYREIAETLDVPETFVGTLLLRARRQLRREIAERHV